MEAAERDRTTDAPVIFPKVLAKRVGTQRTIRVVARTYPPDGGKAIREVLACGHSLDPPPVGPERKYRVCERCERRLGRVMSRLGRKPAPEEIDLIATERLAARSDLGRARRRIAMLEREVRELRALMPCAPVVGQVTAGRMVLEVTARRVVWAPAWVLERNGSARGIKESTPRKAWLALCQKEWTRGG